MIKVGIVGAGIVGRLLAWHLCQKNFEVHIFDQNVDAKTCSLAAAGMISPYSEGLYFSLKEYKMAMTALIWWPKIIASLEEPVYYQTQGNWVITHRLQTALLDNFIQRIQKKYAIKLAKQSFAQEGFIGCHVPKESWIDPVAVLKALADYSEKKNVQSHAQYVHTITKQQLETDQHTYYFDNIIDCRGIGAKQALHNLRGLRGELLQLKAIEVSFLQPIRLLHPRLSCYIVPRPDSIYLIGATQLENENSGSITVRSTLELLSAATKVHPGFYEAEIISTQIGIRPTFSNHFPSIVYQNGVYYINGMYRHGFLFSPIVTAQMAKILSEK